MRELVFHPGVRCECVNCQEDMATARRLLNRNPSTDVRDLNDRMRPFIAYVRQEYRDQCAARRFSFRKEVLST